MKIQVSKVEGPRPITPLEHVGSEVGHEKTETWGKVVSRADLSVHFFEGDVLAVARKDSW